MPKSKSIFKALKSSLGPLVSPGSPSAGRSGRSPATTGTPINTPILSQDLVLNNLATACRITKDTAEALDKVPYVKAVTGVVAQIIKIHEEIQGNKERCNEIISMVTEYTYTAIECLADLYTAGGEQRLESLRAKLELFQSYLEGILKNELKPLKAQSGWKAYTKRDKDVEDMQRIERELKAFVDQFLMKGVTVGISASEATKPILSEIQQTVLRKEWLRSEHAQYNVAFVDESPGNVDRSYCAPNTREPVLDRVTTWARDQSPDSPAVFWMVGEGGAGKSTIARTIAKLLDEDTNLPDVVTFFCSRKYTDTNQQAYIISMIAYQLAGRCPFYASELLKDTKIVDSLRVISKQMDALLVQPWKASSGSRSPEAPPFLVIIDALDEIVSKEEGSGMSGGFAFLRSLLKAIEHNNLKGIKFFVTSRPHPELADVCRSLPSDAICRLFDIPTNEVEQDIHRYLQHSLPELRKPADLQLLERVAAKADGLFIFASTAVLVADPTTGTTPKEQRLALQGVLDGLADHDTTAGSVNSLYCQVVGDAFKLRQGKALSERLDILHTIICTEDRISMNVLVNLVLKEDDDVEDVQAMVKDLLHKLHAVLWISDGRISWYHASFLDFLLSPTSATIALPGKILDASCNVHSQHARLARRCFDIMRSHLKFNICELPSSKLLDSEVEDLTTRIDAHISLALRYACRYWAIHTSKALGDGIQEDIQRFLEENLLFWIEAMNLVRQSGMCASLLNIVQNYVLNNCPHSLTLRKHLSSASYFSTVFKGSPASKSTPHLYMSILVYTAPHFPLFQKWRARFARLPKIRIMGIGTQLLMTLNDHTQSVNSVAFSADSSRIVSGSADHSVRVWDVQTGEKIKRLDGHTAGVNSVAFSFDQSLIVSGSDDRSVRVWDVQTGEQIIGLRGHASRVTSVAFSSDGSRIVSGSDDRSVRIWNAQMGEQINKLEGHTNWVNSVAFSSDGSRIVSGSWDHSVRVWDVQMGNQVNRFNGHTDCVNFAAFSSNGSRIVSGSRDRSVRVWDVHTGKEVKKLDGHTRSVSSVAFSPDGCRIVSGSWDRRLRVWDVHTGEEINRLDGHTSVVKSVAFSSDDSRIVSGSKDCSVRVWDIQTGEEVNKLDGHTDFVNSVSLSFDGSRIVSGSRDRSVRVWDVQTGEQINKLEGHTDLINSVAVSPDGSRIVSGSRDSSVRVWDVQTGEQITKLEGHTNWVSSAAFSSDGSRIVSGSWDCSVRVWNVQTGEQINRLDGHTSVVKSVAFSSDDSRIVSGSDDCSVRVWDVLTGEEVNKLDSHTDAVNSIAFSFDCSHIVSGSSDHSVRVWDARTGEEVNRLDGHTDAVQSAAFSFDRSRVVSGSRDRSVRVWDVQTGEEVNKFDGHADAVQSVAFSFDGSRIISGSWDCSVRVWDIQTGKNIKQFNSPPKLVKSIAISSDVISDSHHRSARVFAAASPDEQQKLTRHPTSSPSSTAYTLDSNSAFLTRPMRQLNWTVSDKGWIVQLPTMNRIMWLPDTLTAYLYRPSNSLIISERTVKLDLEGVEFGSNWTLCYGQ